VVVALRLGTQLGSFDEDRFDIVIVHNGNEWDLKEAARETMMTVLCWSDSDVT